MRVLEKCHQGGCETGRGEDCGGEYLLVSREEEFGEVECVGQGDCH